MKCFWLSWWHTDKDGTFELHSPWWRSGWRGDDASVCAAVRAESEEAAKEIILASFDVRPVDLEWRFCEERPEDWSPFSDRFTRRDWMQW